VTPLFLLSAAVLGFPGIPADTIPAQVGRDAILAFDPPPLVFEPPVASEHEVLGVPVFHLHDPSLPLVDFQLQLRGGVSHLPRERMAAATALPSMLRNGGTLRLPPDSLDRRLDELALQLAVGSGGGGTSIGLNALTHTADEGMSLLREILLQPGFDEEALEVWRGQEREWIRRREDDPAGLAYAEFNRLMFGDHPVGWILGPEDLTEDRLSTTLLRELHGLLICRDRLTLGISGDLTWDEAEPRIREFLEPWPECTTPLPPPPVPRLRDDGGVFVLPKETDQSTVILAQPGGVLEEDSPEFFASRIANHLLGASGFTSRIMSRVRTEQGLAYGASSIWTASIRHEGIVGAVTATRAERTLETTRLLLEILEDFRRVPPTQEEVRDALDEIANGYVFAFGSASQIVARRMAYRAQGLPDDWLERYLEGIQGVTAEEVRAVTLARIDPPGMTILIVGDPTRFDPGLDLLGPLHELSPDGSIRPWVSPASEPSGALRSLP